jgi:hypothetical protein
MIGILISDGDPSFCSDSLNTLARIPRQHLEATGIRTFVMGMTGAAAATLEAIAEEAGAPEHEDFCDPSDENPSCHYWSVGDGDPAAFVAALNAIQETAVGCEFAVPSTEEGLIKLDTVRVEMSADGGTLPLVLDQASDEAACSDQHYTTGDLDGTPTIRLCPATCARMTDTTRLDVTVECYGD